MNGARDRVTYQKLVTRSRYGLVRCAICICLSHQRDDTVTAGASVDVQRDAVFVKNSGSFQITAMPFVRRLVAGMSSQRAGFNPRPVQIRLVENTATGFFFLLLLRFSPLIIILPKLHTHTSFIDDVVK